MTRAGRHANRVRKPWILGGHNKRLLSCTNQIVVSPSGALLAKTQISTMFISGLDLIAIYQTRSAESRLESKAYRDNPPMPSRMRRPVERNRPTIFETNRVYGRLFRNGFRHWGAKQLNSLVCHFGGTRERMTIRLL